MSERLFKVLGENGQAYHGGNGQWSLPQNDAPGEWMTPIEGELIPCENGYHLCRERDLVKWLGPTIYAVEYRGDRIDDDVKIVVREARLLHQYDTWNERTARLFACDCAERVVHLIDDERSVNAIKVARQYASGEATDEELAAARDAAWAAARATAGAAAWYAAGAAARAAARAAAGATAWYAAGAAARAAAGATAWYAAGAAEREWQTQLLMQYLDGEV